MNWLAIENYKFWVGLRKSLLEIRNWEAGAWERGSWKVELWNWSMGVYSGYWEWGIDNWRLGIASCELEKLRTKFVVLYEKLLLE